MAESWLSTKLSSNYGVIEKTIFGGSFLHDRYTATKNDSGEQHHILCTKVGKTDCLDENIIEQLAELVTKCRVASITQQIHEIIFEDGYLAVIISNDSEFVDLESESKRNCLSLSDTILIVVKMVENIKIMSDNDIKLFNLTPSLILVHKGSRKVKLDLAVIIVIFFLNVTKSASHCHRDPIYFQFLKPYLYPTTEKNYLVNSNHKSMDRIQDSFDHLCSTNYVNSTPIFLYWLGIVSMGVVCRLIYKIETKGPLFYNNKTTKEILEYVMNNTTIFHTSEKCVINEFKEIIFCLTDPDPLIRLSIHPDLIRFHK
jgi:hypothetical protein